MRKQIKKPNNTMTYRFREVKCPWCDHVFMWNRDGREGIIINQYRLKDTGESIETAVCPMCENEVAVLDGIFEAIAVDDSRIEDSFSNIRKR